MTDRTPLVSIGLPVYNGENYLPQAIDSILDQSFEDFELIISDNASTDQTEAISRRYLKSDSRITYHRNPQNLGPAWNFNQTVKVAAGKYFKWLACDDLVDRQFLEKTVQILENDPKVVLCYSQTQIIDELGQFQETYVMPFPVCSDKQAECFYNLTRPENRCYQIFGLIRRNVLASTPLIESYAGSDRVLLARLRLEGAFQEVSKCLMSQRRHANQSVEILYNPKRKFFRLHEYTLWFDPALKNKLVFPNWSLFFGYLRAIAAVPLNLKQTLLCYGQILRWLISYGNLLKLGKDFVAAIFLWLGDRKSNLVPKSMDAQR